ncbi:hypothetical protein ACW9HQ_41950, partial [Nocardia gipuzkoensis]
RFSVAAAGLEPARKAGHDLIAINEPLVASARDSLVDVLKRLGPFVKRKPGARWVYLLCWALLLLGDIAGLSGAAISYGEIPALAVMQATSASVATVLAGMAGGEFKYIKQARERDPGDRGLPPDLEPYRTLLLGPLAARKYVTVATAVFGLVALAVALGIAALRATIEGPVAGIVYGGFAIGIACGSWWNCYRYADAVADKIEATRQAYRVEVRGHNRIARSWWMWRAERAREQAVFLREQHRLH